MSGMAMAILLARPGRRIRPLLFDLLVCVIVLAAIDTPHGEDCGPSCCFNRFYGPQLYPHRRYFDRAHPPGAYSTARVRQGPSDLDRDFRDTPR
jgi:hypothetical protein